MKKNIIIFTLAAVIFPATFCMKPVKKKEDLSCEKIVKTGSACLIAALKGCFSGCGETLENSKQREKEKIKKKND